jgi:hypothetical protein
VPDHLFRDRLERQVLDHLDRDDAVTIERRLREDLRRSHRLGDGDGRLPRLAEVREDLPRRRRRGASLVARRVDGGERQVPALHQSVERGEHLPRPLHRGDDLGDADAPVAVAIHQRERPLVDLESLHRARERHPELRVEFAQCEEIGTAVEGDLIGAACAEELPGVGHVAGRREDAAVGEVPSCIAVRTMYAA